MVSAMSVGIRPGRRGAGRGGASSGCSTSSTTAATGSGAGGWTRPVACLGAPRPTSRPCRWPVAAFGCRSPWAARAALPRCTCPGERRAPAAGWLDVGFSWAPDEYSVLPVPSTVGPAARNGFRVGIRWLAPAGQAPATARAARCSARPNCPERVTASTPPVSEFRRYSRPAAPDSSRALTTRSVPSALSVSLVPAVRYRPASTTQSSPSEMPTPEFAPSRQPAPMVTCSLPPPDSVPMIDAPPPTSLPSPTITPCEIRPSTIEVPMVPAL